MFVLTIVGSVVVVAVLLAVVESLSGNDMLKLPRAEAGEQP